MPATVKISIDFEELDILESVYQSLKVETNAKIKRGKVTITKEELKLNIEIFGDDLVATRGLVNSILRLAHTSVNVITSLNEGLD